VAQEDQATIHSTTGRGPGSFGLGASYTSIIGGEILELWQLSAEGKRQQWTDTFKYLIMSYWKEKE